MPDINKKHENPENQESFNQAEQIEAVPAQVEVEKKIETEKPVEAAEIKEIEEKIEEPSVSAPAVSQPVAPTAKSPELEKIEDVLQEDLEDIYFKMSPEKQAEFRQAGEQTASKIAQLLGETKIKIKKILELIRNWLKIIPGVNRFFLEQEAKIKTDKILDLKGDGSAKDTLENKN